MAGMTQERFDAIKQYLSTGRVLVNTETGDVNFPLSRNSKNQIWITKDGYKTVSMEFQDGRYRPVKVHQIVAVSGGLDPVGKTIDHINGNKQDNRLCNLRVLTQSEHSLSAWHEQNQASVENRARNEDSGKTNMSNRFVALIKYSLSLGGSVMALSKIAGVSHSRISEIKSGKTWKEITVEEYL